MKTIADISIFNDLADLVGVESTDQGDSSAPIIGSNVEYNTVRQARNLQDQCNELIQKLNEVQATKQTRRKDIQWKLLKAIDDLDDRIFKFSQRAPENTPTLRGAFYDVSQAHDSLVRKYHMIYDNFSYKDHTPYMSREAYVNRPVPTAGPQHGPGSGSPISYGGFMEDGPRNSFGALSGIPAIPETALASAAAVSLLKTHQNFKNWYSRVCEFGRISKEMQSVGVPMPEQCNKLWSALNTKDFYVTDDNIPKDDMMDLWVNTN